MNNYILLTGGNGYIGYNLYKQLSNLYNIIIFDSTDGNNLLNVNSISNIFEKYKIDLVIHLAGFKCVPDSIIEPLDYYSNNIIGTINLLNVMKIYKCNNIIFSSSASVYGNIISPIKEKDIILCNQTNPYARTKLYIENILNDLYISDNKWNIIILRYFNPVGGYNYIDINNISNPNFFINILKCIKNNDTLNIFGNDYHTRDGTCIRDFIHIRDLIEAHISSIEFIINNNFPIKIYNIGTGKGYTLLEIVNNFNTQLLSMNKDIINYKYCPKRIGDIDINYSDCSLIKKELGWEAKYNLDDMISNSVVTII